MKKIYGYVKDYFRRQNKGVLLSATALTALLVFANYHYQLNRQVGQLSFAGRFLSWYLLFLVIFTLGYALQEWSRNTGLFSRRQFRLLLFLAPALFAWKMSYVFDPVLSADVLKNEYWNAVLYWPFKVAVITITLWLVHRWLEKDQPFYGVTLKSFSARPYLFMLLLMVPLIIAAATQHDFLRMYPRMQNLAYLQQPDTGFYKLLYELSYGSDFFSIELFFRGFLVLAFARRAGMAAILPMAMFYCTIHFGKPLGECISSYFGGMILGIVSYHTRSILGGFIVHVGIAWLMELAGYLSPLGH